jgi:hypothetical protein
MLESEPGWFGVVAGCGMSSHRWSEPPIKRVGTLPETV